MIRRDWSAAREKVEREGCCRLASRHQLGDTLLTVGLECEGPVEAAHIVGRKHDGDLASFIPNCAEHERKGVLFVAPSRVVPLCRKHHQMYDSHQLDLLGYLTAEEEAQAVLDAGSLESARRRLCPSEYRGTVTWYDEAGNPVRTAPVE